ncbi:MAG: tyrosine-type recombinase/integrase, partial [Chloroflexota bacterium]|nr:tyrosine-type recombinase/integrase [Chloroflexota bacterium]
MDLDVLGPFERLGLARKVFGRARVDAAIRRVTETDTGWGYGQANARALHLPVCEALLTKRSPMLEELTAGFLDELRQRAVRRHMNEGLYVLSRALYGMGMTDRPPLAGYAMSADRRHRDPTAGVASEWAAWCQRWQDTSTLSPKVRHAYYLLQLKAGRWVTCEHPDCVSPEAWTRDLAVTYVAVVDRLTIGELAARTERLASQKVGKPLTPKAKVHHIAAMSAFFRDCQEWGWLPRRFDPRRCFAVPRSIRALIGPNPRVLADDVWAKLLWAGTNLAEADLSRHFNSGHSYPLPMVRALALVWLFAGLRSNEIRRLRVGCIRWQDETVGVAGTTPANEQKTCLLDVPVHKTGSAFTKPVDRVVGEAIGAWERVRTEQPGLVDPKTAEAVNFLFAFRGRRVGFSYLNGTLIPLLCRKAGVPTRDARGNITTHRARSTIASQLGNAREPMSLLELQQWLGQRWPASTLHYLRVTPTRLAKAYADAGYFGRNLRLIEVLIDQDAIKNGGAAAGQPW